jgi:hypothetical protein
MDTQIVAVFCLCDDMLKALDYYQDKQCQMSDAEVMATALVAALHFRGNFELARRLLQEQGYIPTMKCAVKESASWPTCSSSANGET